MFTEAESDACLRLVEWAIREDLGPAGDITSRTLLPADLRGRAQFVQRSVGVIAGLPAVAATLETIDGSLHFEPQVADGTLVQPGQVLAAVTGSLRSILTAERVALNFLQRLSGVAIAHTSLCRCGSGADGGDPGHPKNRLQVGDCSKNTLCVRAVEATIGWVSMTAYLSRTIIWQRSATIWC